MNTTTRGRYRKPRTRNPLYILAALAAVGMLLLAGACSADTEADLRKSTDPVADETESAPEPEPVVEEPEPTPEPKSEPTALSIEQAADRYLEIIGPVNAAATEADALIATGRYREGCEAMIKPDRKSLDKFAAEQWPGDVDRLIKDQLIPLTETEIAAYSSCASASSDRKAEEIAWSDVYDAQEARGAVSGAVRTLLGLPQVTQ